MPIKTGGQSPTHLKISTQRIQAEAYLAGILSLEAATFQHFGAMQSLSSK